MADSKPRDGMILTTESIQKCLDENQTLILAILENQNLGKTVECSMYQARLQNNLMYLSKIASMPQNSDKQIPSQVPAQNMNALPTGYRPNTSNSYPYNAPSQTQMYQQNGLPTQAPMTQFNNPTQQNTQYQQQLHQKFQNMGSVGFNPSSIAQTYTQQPLNQTSSAQQLRALEEQRIKLQPSFQNQTQPYGNQQQATQNQQQQLQNIRYQQQQASMMQYRQLAQQQQTGQQLPHQYPGMNSQQLNQHQLAQQQAQMQQHMQQQNLQQNNVTQQQYANYQAIQSRAINQSMPQTQPAVIPTSANFTISNESAQQSERENAGAWTSLETEKFMEALTLFGDKDVKKIKDHVVTRSVNQVRGHLSKYLQKIKREEERKKKDQESSASVSPKFPYQNAPNTVKVNPTMSASPLTPSNQMQYTQYQNQPTSSPYNNYSLNTTPMNTTSMNAASQLSSSPPTYNTSSNTSDPLWDTLMSNDDSVNTNY